MILLAPFSKPQYRFGGPRYVQLPFDLDRGIEITPRGGGSVRSAPPPQSSLPAPITNAQELAGGLTLAQLDQAAQMEVEEGAPILIGYGELLLGGTLVSHKY